MIFSKTGCKDSTEAKRLFDDLKVKYTAVEMDRREDGYLMQCYFANLTGSDRTPKIYIIGKFIGGVCELENLHITGGLVNLLKQN